MKRNLYHHFMALMFVILLIPVWFAVSHGDVRTSKNQVTDQDKQKILEKVYDLGMPFIANQGQVAKEVGFYGKTFGGTVYVTRQGEMVYFLTKKEQDQAFAKRDKEKKSPNAQVCVLKERLFQAKKISPVGVEKSVTKVNYFIGSNQDKWKTNVPSFNSVSLGEVYDHIDFALRAHGNNVEKIFTVHPKGKVQDIRLAVEGALALSVTPKGDLEVDTGSGIINFSVPIAFQEIDDKRQKVQVTYALKGKTYGFKVGEYNLKFALIIDPSLVYSNILDGEDNDYGYGIAVDSSGNAYVTGSTYSTDFPTKKPFQPSLIGTTYDAFVTKFTSTGTISYSTYLGGNDEDYGRGIAVDSSGNAYVTGNTKSTDFPTKNPFQDSYGGGNNDIFVTKFTSTGTLSYSTYLGGDLSDVGYGIAVDSSGNAYVTGSIFSTDFPTKNPFQPNAGGGLYGFWDRDAFVTKFTSTGTLSYSTYLGGDDDDYGYGIAVDSSGNAYVTGNTDSTDFPTKNPYDDTKDGSYDDAFVTKFTSTGTLSYSTYLGGSDDDSGRGIAVDSSGNAFVTGSIYSTDFPTKNPFQPNAGGGFADHDAFVTKFTSTGTISYSTYLGGNDEDYGLGIAVDSSGNTYVTGYTTSDDFPQKPDSDTANYYAAFITKFGATYATNKAMPWIPLLLLDE